MATYTVKAPDGKTVTLQGPAGASQADIIAQAQRLYRPNAAPTPARRPAPAPAARPAAPAAPPQPGTADFYAARWAKLTPQQATALYRKGRQEAIANGQDLDSFHDDPRIQAIRRVAGAAPIVTRGARARAAGRAAADETPRGTFADMASSFGTGLRRMVPGARQIAAGVLAARDSNVNYSDALQAIDARDEALQARAPGSGIVGNVFGAVTSGAGLGRVVSGGATRLAASASPAIARTGNVLQNLSTLRRGQKVANAGRLAAQGAGFGAVQGATDTDLSRPGKAARDITTSTAVGAVAAPLLAAGVKGVGVLTRPVRDMARLSTAGQILRRFTTATQAQLEARAAAYRQATGAEPTVFELLPLVDRNRILKQAVVGRDNVVEQTSGAIRQRAANLGPEMSARARAIVQPQRDATAAGIQRDLEAARGAPDAGDAAMAERASNSPTDMLALRDEEARLIMAPHDGARVVDNFHDVLPSVPHPAHGAPIDIDPEVSSAIRSAAGTLPRRPNGGGITAGEISGIITKLRGRLNSAVSSERDTAERAIDHLHDVLDANAPAAGDAARRMTDAYAARSRMAEGMQEGSRTRLRDDVQVGTSRDTARTVRNAYNTPEGDAGRVLGQSNRVLSELGGSPEEALRATVRMSRNSTGRQLEQNIGGPQSRQLMDAARAQDESAQAFAAASQKVAGDGGDAANGEALVQALVGLHPGSFIATKAGAMRKLMDMTFIPEARARTMVDMLFSQDATMTRRALNAIGNSPNGAAFQRFLAGVTGQMAGDAAVGSETPPEVVTPQAGDVPEYEPEPALPEDEIAPVEGEGDGTLDADGGQAVEESDSPYVAHLQEIYDNESPEMLDLIGRVSGRESGGRQHDDNGRPLRSSAGAVGVMQVMPDTAPEAARLAGVPFDRQAYLHDPAYNKLIGVAYLSELLRRYDGDVAKATAAYNAGQGRVDKAIAAGGNWLSRLPEETQAYVEAIS